MKLKKNSMKLMCLPIAASLLLTACNKESSIQPAEQNNAQRVTAATGVTDFTVYFDSNVPKDKKTVVVNDILRIYQILVNPSIIKAFAKNPIYVTNGKTGSIAFKDSAPSGIYISNVAAYEVEKNSGWALPLLRELTKAYHAQVLGLNYAPVVKLYNAAKLKKAKTTENAKNVQEYLGNAVENYFSPYGSVRVNDQDADLYKFIGNHFVID